MLFADCTGYTIAWGQLPLIPPGYPTVSTGGNFTFLMHASGRQLIPFVRSSHQNDLSHLTLAITGQ